MFAATGAGVTPALLVDIVDTWIEARELDRPPLVVREGLRLALGADELPTVERIDAGHSNPTFLVVSGDTRGDPAPPAAAPVRPPGPRRPARAPDAARPPRPARPGPCPDPRAGGSQVHRRALLPHGGTRRRRPARHPRSALQQQRRMPPCRGGTRRRPRRAARRRREGRRVRRPLPARRPISIASLRCGRPSGTTVTSSAPCRRSTRCPAACTGPARSPRASRSSTGTTSSTTCSSPRTHR